MTESTLTDIDRAIADVAARGSDHSELLAFTVRYTSGYVCVALTGAEQALVRLDQEVDESWSSTFELSVRAFGTGSHELAQRLRAAVHQWHASGRPATAGLRIRAYPRASTTAGNAAAIIDKQYSRLLLDWPQQSGHRSK